jgi:hypothetical protein
MQQEDPEAKKAKKTPSSVPFCHRIARSNLDPRLVHVLEIVTPRVPQHQHQQPQEPPQPKEPPQLQKEQPPQSQQERPELARIKAEISIATFEIIKTKENKKACAAELQRWDTATAGSVHHHAAYDALVARKSDLARAQEFLAAAKRREAQAQALQDSLSADESGTAAQFQLTSAAAHFRAARVQAELAVAAAEGLFQKAKAFAAKAGVDEIIAETSSTARALLVAKAKASEAGAIAAMVAGSLAMQMGRDALLEVRATADVIESRLETMQTAILMP